MRFSRNTRKIPKEFRAPRPMSGAARPEKRIWNYLPLEVIAVALAVIVAWLSPLAKVDQWLFAKSLLLVGSEQPARSVSLVIVDAESLGARACGDSIAGVLAEGGARAGLLVSPVDELCASALEVHNDSEVAPPLGRLAPEVLRLSGDNQVLGFKREAAGPLERSLGFADAEWVAPRAQRAVPTLRLSQLMRKEVHPSLLSKRVVVVALGGGVQPTGASIAAAISAALDDQPRRQAPLLLVLLVALLANGAVIFVLRGARRRSHIQLAVLFSASLVFTFTVLGALGVGRLIPAATLLLSIAVSYLVMHWPQRAAASRADESAARLLANAQRLVRNQRPQALSDSEFWQRLANRAGNALPADDVLVAELPAYNWRLKVWPNGELTESVIKERRRDIRRTPYANEHGAPVASVTQNFLIMKDVPTVLVPLTAAGEVEGYLMLIGKPAARHFASHPKQIEKLADEFGALIRGRRLAKLKNEDWRRAGGRLIKQPAGRATGLLDGARAAIEELRLLSALLRHAPVGLFYADSFGDVRIISQAAQRWLPEYDIPVPAVGVDGGVEPGRLPLKRMLDILAQEAGGQAPPLTELTTEGYSIEIPVRHKEGRATRALKLTLIRLDKNEDGVDAGFVGSFTELFSRTESIVPRVSRLPQRGDPLAVFSLAQLTKSVVGDVIHRGEGQAKFQTPREMANIVGHKAELRHALLTFLADCARRGGKKAGPVLSLKERQFRVELRIMDIKLGVPLPALRRTLMAPSDPPPGLDELGELVRAVENSHGMVALRAEEGWGVVLTLSFVRARPRVETDTTSPLINLKRHNRTIKL